MSRDSGDARPIDLTVTTSGGTGTASALLPGSAEVIFANITPPNDTDSYDFEIDDANDKLIEGAEGLAGESVVPIERPIKQKFTVTISNASTDGDHAVRLWTRFGV